MVTSTPPIVTTHSVSELHSEKPSPENPSSHSHVLEPISSGTQLASRTQPPMSVDDVLPVLSHDHSAEHSSSTKLSPCYEI